MAYKRHTIIARSKSAGNVFLTVEWDGKRLSMTGVEGPLANGDARGSCGQIDMHEWTDYTATPGVDLHRIRAIWQRWHLNDTRAGCAHQHDWPVSEKVEVVTYKLTTAAWQEQNAIKNAAMKRLKEGREAVLTPDQLDVVNLPWERTTPPDTSAAVGRYEVDKREHKALGWLRCDEDPRGLLCKPCAICGHKYGSAWLHEDVPAEVIAFLQSLPDDGASYPWR